MSRYYRKILDGPFNYDLPDITPGLQRTRTLKEVFSKLEKEVFEYVMYPKITYKNQQLLSCEERDKDFIEGVFINLYSCIGPYSCHPIMFVIKHYERYYKTWQRIYRIKQLNNFYSIAVRHLFFYAYEVNTKIQDDEAREEYLESYLLKAYAIKRLGHF